MPLNCNVHITSSAAGNLIILEVPIIPKYFFRLTISLHLFDTHCASLPLFNPNIDLLHALKVTKSGHHLSHDRASKGYGSIPGLTSQTSLHACLQRLKYDANQSVTSNQE